MTPERLNEIEVAWVGDGEGLAVTGNSSYRMVAELIDEVKRLRPVIEAAANWYHWHGYIPELVPKHYETPLIDAVRALKLRDVLSDTSVPS